MLREKPIYQRILKNNAVSFLQQMPPAFKAERCILLFGEQIPADAIEQAKKAVETCKIMVIIGTSGVLYPAEIPFLAASKEASIIEINVSPTPFTSAFSLYFLEGNSSIVLPQILDELKIRVV